MMKKAYVAPSLEIELYQLDANIAGNCTEVVNMGGPGSSNPDEPFCKEYGDIVGISLMSAPVYNVNFWESTCDCYTTAQAEFGFFTS